jgi:HSP20 family protein
MQVDGDADDVHICGSSYPRFPTTMDNLSGDFRQIVCGTANSNLKLLILLPAPDGTSIANQIAASAKDRWAIMVRNSLVPVHSGGFLERDFGHPFLSLHREMTHLFDDVFHGRSGDRMQDGSLQRGPMMPSIDVSETDNEVRISADLPGVSESDIDVSLVDDILTIRAEKKFDKKDEKENYHLVERSYGTFLRALRLPYSVDTDKIRAEFDNGVLTVTVTKCKDKEQSRKIPVQSGRNHGSAPSSELKQREQEGQRPKK